ncbi:HAD hydrolase family protein [Staphylococcus epidermidis]|nr:HAD hydrolase family protein [Staphylococcus epidermidis]MDU2696711.1 HAD hydrolase family protein [Staphylococcus epidermidis]
MSIYAKTFSNQLFHKDVDKGKTICFLQDLLNISSEQIIVFGD